MLDRLMYENMGGMLVRRDGFLHWSCQHCKAKGQSDSILEKCPKCKSKPKKENSHD